MPDSDSEVRTRPDWRPVCPVAELSGTDAVRLDVRPPVTVWNADGAFYATDDTCTHAESSLADGYLEDGVVECILHLATFCVRTGAALSAPATEPLATYPVRVTDDTVFVDLGARDETPGQQM